MTANKNNLNDRTNKLKNDFAFQFSLWATLFGCLIFPIASNIYLRQIFDSFYVIRRMRTIVGDLIFMPLLVVIFVLATFVVIPCIDGKWFRRWLLKSEKSRRSIVAGVSGFLFIVFLSTLIFLIFGINFRDALVPR